MGADGSIEDRFRDATLEARAFYLDHAAAVRHRGIEVLYGPPVHRPPIVFIGFQPGGHQRVDMSAISIDDPDPWPAECLYATASWPLASRMQEMFGVPLLRRCTGLNAIFIRSPDVATYTNEVPLATRMTAAAFCKRTVIDLIGAMEPTSIVAIGLATLRAFGPTSPALCNQKGRTLIESGIIAGRPALSTLHLSGCRISKADRESIADFVLRAAEAS